MDKILKALAVVGGLALVAIPLLYLRAAGAEADRDEKVERINALEEAAEILRENEARWARRAQAAVGDSATVARWKAIAGSTAAENTELNRRLQSASRVLADLRSRDTSRTADVTLRDDTATMSVADTSAGERSALGYRAEITFPVDSPQVNRVDSRIWADLDLLWTLSWNEQNEPFVSVDLGHPDARVTSLQSVTDVGSNPLEEELARKRALLPGIDLDLLGDLPAWARTGAGAATCGLLGWGVSSAGGPGLAVGLGCGAGVTASSIF